jgi:hypothetical protein
VSGTSTDFEVIVSLILKCCCLVFFFTTLHKFTRFMIWCRSCPFWKFARSIARLQKCCKLWYFPFSLVYTCVFCVWLKCTIKWKLCVITSSEKSPWCFTKVWGWKQDFQSIKGKYHYDTVTILSPSSLHCHHHYNPHQHRVITINLWCSIASTTATTNFISTIMINPTILRRNTWRNTASFCRS